MSKLCKYFIKAFNSVIQLTVATVISSLLQILSSLTAFLIASQYLAKSNDFCKGVDLKNKSVIEQVFREGEHGHYEVFILGKRKQRGKMKKNGHLEMLSILNELNCTHLK